jgi:hypothetical protein
MRIAHVLTLIGAAALSLSAAAAPANTDSSASSMATVNVAHDTYKMHADDVKAVLGTYSLHDGRTLRVSTKQRKLYAEVDGVKTEIFKVGGARFASRDDALRVSFDNGSITDEVIVSTLAAR